MSTSLLNYLTPLKLYDYVEGMETRCLAAHRLSVVRWKTPTAQVNNPNYKKLPTVCCSLPSVSLSCAPDVLQAAMQAALEDMQDAAVRSTIAQAVENNSRASLLAVVIPSELGTAEGLAAFASAQAASGRLSKEGLAAWFTSSLAAPLTEALVDRLVEVATAESLDGSLEDSEALRIEEAAKAQVAKAKAAIEALASPRANMSPMVAKQLQKALSFAPSGDRVRKQLEAKLEVFINPKVAEELLLNL